MNYRLKACPIGTLPVPGWECFFGCNDPSFHPLTFYVWIVRRGNRVGLIDTGLPMSPIDLKKLDQANQKVDQRCVYSDVVLLDALLKRERLRPADIDFVAITQPITYHTGGLLPQFFPRAEVFMSRAGMLEFLLEKIGHPPRDFYFTEPTWAFLRQLLLEDRLRLIDEATEIRPGIFFETTGGHHSGSAGVRVTTKDGTVGILETAFLQRNLDEDLPIGVAEDAAACRRAIKRYKAICDIVVADHDATNGRRFSK